jgi:hypothetical protein
LDELHDDGRLPIGLLEPVNLGNIRVIERGQDLGLALETSQPVGVRDESRRQHLECDFAFERRVGGPIHLAGLQAAACVQKAPRGMSVMCTAA